jgi:hypothetical protein
MPGASRVMREVVAVMTADRILTRLLDEAVEAETITRRQAGAVTDASLRNLLPSAAQEASEEGGITDRPTPAYVLDTVHLLKTGLLFNIPFTGVDLIEETIDRDRLARIKQPCFFSETAARCSTTSETSHAISSKAVTTMCFPSWPTPGPARLRRGANDRSLPETVSISRRPRKVSQPHTWGINASFPPVRLCRKSACSCPEHRSPR